jgi:hypothetical protein
MESNVSTPKRSNGSGSGKMFSLNAAKKPVNTSKLKPKNVDFANASSREEDCTNTYDCIEIQSKRPNEKDDIHDDPHHSSTWLQRSGEEEDDISLNSAFTEFTLVPRRNLGFVQASALMINQMIGTGIFTTPGIVLLLTKSKPIALVLWASGGVYSLLRLVTRNKRLTSSCILIDLALSVLLYLEFATAFPYNGGALIYVRIIFCLAVNESPWR